MSWSNFLIYLGHKLRSELVLLGLALAWLLVRLFRAVVGNIEKGKPIIIRLLGVNLVEVKKGDELHILRAKGEIHHVDVLGIHRKGSHMSLQQMGVPDLSAKNPQNHLSNAKEVDIKYGRSRK